MVIEKTAQYPLIISMNIMLISPITDTPIPKLKIPPESLSHTTADRSRDQQKISVLPMSLQSWHHATNIKEISCFR